MNIVNVSLGLVQN